MRYGGAMLASAISPRFCGADRRLWVAGCRPNPQNQLLVSARLLTFTQWASVLSL